MQTGPSIVAPFHSPCRANLVILTDTEFFKSSVWALDQWRCSPVTTGPSSFQGALLSGPEWSLFLPFLTAVINSNCSMSVLGTPHNEREGPRGFVPPSSESKMPSKLSPVSPVTPTVQPSVVPTVLKGNTSAWSSTCPGRLPPRVFSSKGILGVCCLLLPALV